MSLKKPGDFFNQKTKDKVEIYSQSTSLPESYDTYKSNLKNIEVLAGGGGGSAYNSPSPAAGDGGAGGGGWGYPGPGDWPVPSGISINGMQSTGGGGGGAERVPVNTANRGGNGGSGIVIIAYPS